jgi:hypothetical protein
MDTGGTRVDVITRPTCSTAMALAALPGKEEGGPGETCYQAWTSGAPFQTPHRTLKVSAPPLPSGADMGHGAMAPLQVVRWC